MENKKYNWADITYFGNEVKYAREALESGWVSSSGEFVTRAETYFSGLYESSALTTSNGTSALQLAFLALGVKPGDEVLVPAYGFHAGLNVLLEMGVKPVLYDMSSETWSAELSNIKRSYSDAIKGLLLVYNWGGCGNVSEIINWAKSLGLWVIEDCAEAWFSSYDNKLLGTFGDIATFSMHAAKTITCGEGGLVITRSPKLYELMLQYRSHGLYNSKGGYVHELPGNNFRLSNMHAAIALGQLEEHEKIITQQEMRSNVYRDLIQKFPYFILQNSSPHANPKYWATAIKVAKYLAHKISDIKSIMMNRGVDIRYGFESCNNLNYISNKNGLDVSENLGKSIIVLPCSSALKENDIVNIVEILNQSALQALKSCFENSFECKKELQKFYEIIRTESNNFRYFDKRKFNITETHLVSKVFKSEERVIGYYHIEEENSKHWFGIAVDEQYRGTGLSEILLLDAIEKARDEKLSEIYLSVDRGNDRARKFYEKNGFRTITIDETEIMSLTI